MIWIGRALLGSMLGGGPHSRLFREVREKQSLAYYAHAVVDRHKGLLLVHVGLDAAAAPRVEEETLRQLAALQSGEFEAEELDTARAGILSLLAAVGDSVARRAEWVSHQWILGQDRTPEQQAAFYLQAGRDDVVRAGADIWLDHSYLLAPRDQEEAT